MPLRTVDRSLPIYVFAVVLTWSALLHGQGQEGRTVYFPLPPDPAAIGTAVGPVNTYVRNMTLSAPASVHRFGLEYVEIRGSIEGVGWGGQTATSLLNCHYAYQLPYVLRIPPDWDGTLVTFHHGSGSLGEWLDFEARFGPRNFGRVFHEVGDRFVSDVALHPNRRWAFFSVNYTPVAPGPAFNTRLVGETGCAADTPVQAIIDVPIARDTALAAQRLMKILRGQEPSLTLGTGHSAGANVYRWLNAGIDGARFLHAGDNHRVPYDADSGLIFNGFLSFSSGGGGIIQAANLGNVSAPTLMVVGEAERPSAVPLNVALNQLNQMTLAPGFDFTGLNRIYSVRNLSHVYADLSLAMIRDDVDWIGAFGSYQDYFRGGGESLKGLSGALLDALSNWVTRGIAPPAAIFNGRVVTTGTPRIEFDRTSPLPSTSIPYVDHVDLDVMYDPAPISTVGAGTQATNLRTYWTNVRSAFGVSSLGSVVLSETACRRGGFSFANPGAVGTFFRPFDDVAFLTWWGSSEAYQSCRVETADLLWSAGFHDPTVAFIDIQPDKFPNVVDTRAGGWLPVAIFSTIAFDATEIVPGSLRLAGASMQGTADRPDDLHSRSIDLNGDGRLDLLVEFRMDTLTFGPDDVAADLWGQTRRGLQFSGSDLVQIVR